MAPDCDPSHIALIERADKAISNAIATRAEVQAGLAAARKRPIVHGHPHPTLALVPPLKPIFLDTLEPWWALAKSLTLFGVDIAKSELRMKAGLWQVMTPMSISEAPRYRSTP